MVAYTTKEIRKDHVEWICNNEDFFTMSTPCGHKNPVSVEACNECKTAIHEGAEAVDKDGNVIGEYVGDDLWEYDAEEINIDIKIGEMKISDKTILKK